MQSIANVDVIFAGAGAWRTLAYHHDAQHTLLQ